MDFMQTMLAFVFMIPVIAFFGTGKVAAVIITMIFGGTPVRRLTVLGLKRSATKYKRSSYSLWGIKMVFINKS